MTAHDVYSRNKGTASIDFPHRPDHHFTGFIIVLTYEFKTLDSRTESDPPPGFPRRCVGAGVIDRHFVPHGVEVRTRKALDRVKSVCVRHPFEIGNPHSFVVSDRVHDQRIAFEVADAVPVITGRQILWVTPAIHVNGAKAVRPACLKDDELLQFREMHKLSPIRSRDLPKASGRFATRVGFKLVGLAIVVDGPRPGLEGNLIQRGLSWILVLFTRGRGSRRWDTDCESPSCNVPQAAFFADRRSPIHCAVRPARCRPCWCISTHGISTRAILGERRALVSSNANTQREADQLGIQYAWNAGFDPKGFIAFLDSLAQEKPYSTTSRF